jgi:hypothetical protein
MGDHVPGHANSVTYSPRARAKKFPFSLITSHALKIREQHVITVTGKAFYDIAHASADHSNRRSTPKEYAVWEIHPVMKIEVIQ